MLTVEFTIEPFVEGTSERVYGVLPTDAGEGPVGIGINDTHRLFVLPP